jgi:hypothetical protein
MEHFGIYIIIPCRAAHQKKNREKDGVRMDYSSAIRSKMSKYDETVAHLDVYLYVHFHVYYVFCSSVDP